jgi:hypothetical protein
LRFDDGAQVWVVDCDKRFPEDEEPLRGAELRDEQDDTLRDWLVLADPGVPAIARLKSVLLPIAWLCAASTPQRWAQRRKDTAQRRVSFTR